MSTAAVANKLSDKEKDELIKQLLGKDYNSVGNNLPVLKNVIDVIGHVDTALSVAELLPLINTVLANSRILSIVASGASVFSIFMFPVSSMISIIDAYQVGHRMYSYRAIAYTLSAWAFNKPIPVASQRILLNVREGNVLAKKVIVQEYNDVWKTTSQSVLNKISVELRSKNIPKEAMQIILRAMAENNEQKLCELLMKGFEDKLSPIANLTWKSNYSITYPN